MVLACSLDTFDIPYHFGFVVDNVMEFQEENNVQSYLHNLLT